MAIRRQSISSIIGSGMGGATFAAGLAPTGARSSSSSAASGCATAPTRATRARSSSAAFSGRRRPGSTAPGRPFNPGNYYYVGGNSKLYGAVLIRYRAEDFAPIAHRDGATPGWPFAYDELEPWYSRAEKLYQCPRRARLRPDRAAAFRALSLSAGAGRAGDRQGARAHEARRPAPVSAAARRRHREMAQRAPRRRGTPSRHGNRQDGRGELRRSPRRLRHPNVELRTNARVERLLLEPDGKRIAGVERRSPRRASRDRRQARRAVRRRGQFGGAAAALRRRGPRQSLRRGRPPFHEPQLLGRAGDRSADGQRLGLSEDARRSTISISTTAAAGRRSATSSCSAASPAPILKANIPRAPGMGAGSDEPALRRLVRDERGPAEPGEPRDRRRRADPARLEAQQLGGACGAGEAPSRSGCAPRAIRSCCRSRSTGARRRINAARCASAPIRRRRRSIRFAAPGTTPICSSSTRRSCRPRRRSIRR